MFKEPYSDVLKLYSSVFQQIFFFFFFYKCDRPISSLESPIVAFLSPIVMF